MRTQAVYRQSVKEQELDNFLFRKSLHSSATIITDELNVIKEYITKYRGRPIKLVYTFNKHTIEIVEFWFEGQYKQFYQEVSWEQWYDIFKSQQLKFILVLPGNNSGKSFIYQLCK